jgi:hypothetical protein
MGCGELCSFLGSNLKRPNRVVGAAGYGKTSGVKACTSSNPATCDHYLLASGWADPDPTNPLAFGNAAQNDPRIRSPHYFNEDFSVTKLIPITDQYGLKFESQMGNLFNRHLWCNPDTNFSDGANFGTINAQCDQPRSIQFGLRLEF